MYHLVVRNPFGGLAKGTKITDQATVLQILSDPHRSLFVVKTAVDGEKDSNTEPSTSLLGGGASA
jgi:hypothetical protein